MKPKPIKIRTNKGWAKLKVIGCNSTSQPYLSLDVGRHYNPNPTMYGYIEDRDIKRLKKWCEACLKKK